MTSRHAFDLYVARDLCIFMNEVGWNPDRTIMNGNSIYNGTRISEGAIGLSAFFPEFIDA